MDLAVSYGFYDSLTALPGRRGSTPAARVPSGDAQNPPTSANLPAVLPASNQNGGTRLVAETREDLPDGGYRRTRTFEQEDGRNFTKIEQFTLTERGARRDIVQQNPSGSVTRYEEILDRESGGTFRRTQRFQDETGDVSTVITPGTRVLDPFILTRGDGAPALSAPSPFDPVRGTQLDLRA